VSDKTEVDPKVRVVDRRWWARAAEDGPTDDPITRKPTYVEQLEQQLADRAAQLQVYQTEHRRALEEFEQVKTRIRRDVAREVERGRRAVIAELLEVLDNLDRAVAAGPDGSASALLEGVALVRQQFLAKLEGLGVRRLSALGSTFDAAQHEAVTTTLVQDPSQEGVVVAVIKEGYVIGEEVLRPAAVVVGQREQR
jgi:molecular chaperone GrpE